MGKKSKCCQKSSSSTSSSSCSSSSSSSSSSSCSPSSSSYGYCCPQYPRCKGSCYKNKCVPVYYPNNYVGQYPCNPCPPNPCNPCNPCFPNPCNLTQCSPFYNTYTSILVPSSSTTPSVNNAYTLYLVNPADSSGNIVVPAVVAFSGCCYNKMFVFTNISSSNIFTLTPSGTDTINGLTTVTILPNTSVTLYSSYVGGIGYWSLVGGCNVV